VRFLICPGGGYGSLHPLVPLARALADRGHDVAFVTAPMHCGAVRELGFECFSAGPAGAISGIAATETTAGLAQLGEADRARRIIDAFAAVAEAMVPELSAVVRRWRPDALVRDATAFAAWIVAEQAAIPAALFDFTGVPPALAARVVGPQLGRLRAAFGLPEDPALDSIYRWLVLIGAPPGWTDLNLLAPTAHLIQPPEFDRAPIESPPAWLDSLADGSRLVYATLGTVFGDSPATWAAIFAAVAAEPGIRLVATVGPATDPRGFGALPPGIRVERYVPQSWLLDRACAVIAHGGYGTLMAAVRHGLPALAIPMPAADNLSNATRLAALGAGLMLAPGRRGAEEIRQALRRILDEPAFRQSAGDLAAATATLPSEHAAAQLLERLARERRPVMRAT
jgi:UDP:flavonoid glycosyltransferase YjiC (YdhE family)